MKTLILGAGYAGAAAATSLKPHANLDVTLIERNPYHTIETRLHEAAAHDARVTLPLAPLLQGTGVKLDLAEISEVNLDTREVKTKGGPSYSYDTLVVGLGSVTNFFRIPGLAENAGELKTVEDAQALYQHLNRVFERDYQGNRDIVIGGAGLSGVELITELAQRNQQLAEKTGLRPVKLYLVEAAPTILPLVDAKLRASAQEVLRGYGIDILVGHKIMEGYPDGITVGTPDGGSRRITAGKVVWTGGVMARDILKGEKLEKGPGARVIVDCTMQLSAYPGVFVLGDMAFGKDQNGNPMPPNAQLAGQQGRHMAENLLRLANGQTPTEFIPDTQGEFISLGGMEAVGWMRLPMNKKLSMTGGPAHVMKRASEARWVLSLK